MEMPVIILSGMPYERGFAHGRQFQDEIAHILSRDVALRSNAALLEARKRADMAFKAIWATSLDVAEEIRGIAEGSRQPLADIVLRCGFELFKLGSDSGCSTVAAKSHAGAIVAQNWDAPVEKATELGLFLHFSRNGFEFAVVASLGGLGWVGMNRHGLALVNNDLVLNGYTDGVPSQVVRRLALAEPDTKRATDTLMSMPHMGGRSYLIGDRTGHVAAAEVSAKTGTHFLPAADVQLHTNNALLAATSLEEDQPALLQTYPSSAARLDALQATFAIAERSVEGLKKVLSDETGSPNAVCKTASADEPTQTAFSIIMDCSAGEIHLAFGKPKPESYRKFILPLGG
ncbi:MAG: acyl-CoA-6-aminopenicillanic acid acyltransferase [Rhizobiaceae bacterium]|nr:acyl-CoA-6-aminopenicillanic acid acyltransferase [Rhizobiaceae bacterium]